MNYIQILHGAGLELAVIKIKNIYRDNLIMPFRFMG